MNTIRCKNNPALYDKYVEELKSIHDISNISTTEVMAIAKNYIREARSGIPIHGAGICQLKLQAFKDAILSQADLEDMDQVNLAPSLNQVINQAIQH